MITDFKLFENKLSKEILFENMDNINYIQRWLDEGGDINVKNSNGIPLLILAIGQNFKNSYLLVKFLVENGADVNIQDILKNTPLTHSRNLSIIRILLDNGADLRITNVHGKTLIDYLEENLPNILYENILRIIRKDYSEEWKKYLIYKKTKDFNL